MRTRLDRLKEAGRNLVISAAAFGIVSGVVALAANDPERVRNGLDDPEHIRTCKVCQHFHRSPDRP
jgi:hypothetical protein